MLVLLFLHFFRSKHFHFFFVSIYKELLEPTWETFSVSLIVWNILCEVFGCSIIADLVGTIFGFSKVFG